jgi:hypothetical protein
MHLLISNPQSKIQNQRGVGVLWVFGGCSMGVLWAPKTRVGVALGWPTLNFWVVHLLSFALFACSS